MAREAQGLSPSELARRIGVKPASCSHWESCRSDPSVTNLSKLAVILDVDFDWLATGRGNMRSGVEQRLSPYAADIIPPDQQELLDIYLRLKPQRQRALLDFLRHWG
jgi:transcriptional regulator with XRE-family HTH domain